MYLQSCGRLHSSVNNDDDAKNQYRTIENSEGIKLLSRDNILNVNGTPYLGVSLVGRGGSSKVARCLVRDGRRTLFSLLLSLSQTKHTHTQIRPEICTTETRWSKDHRSVQKRNQTLTKTSRQTVSFKWRVQKYVSRNDWSWSWWSMDNSIWINGTRNDSFDENLESHHTMWTSSDSFGNRCWLLWVTTRPELYVMFLDSNHSITTLKHQHSNTGMVIWNQQTSCLYWSSSWLILVSLNRSNPTIRQHRSRHSSRYVELYGTGGVGKLSGVDSPARNGSKPIWNSVVQVIFGL